MQAIQKIKFVIIALLCSIQIIYAQEDKASIWLQKGNSCWDKHDYKCAKENYELYIQYYKDDPQRVPLYVHENYKTLTSQNDDKNYLTYIINKLISQGNDIENLNISIQEVKEEIIANRNYSESFDNDSSSVYFNNGIIYLNNQEYDNAIVCFERIIDLYPQEPDAYYYIGLANEYKPKTDYDNAMTDYDNAIKWYNYAMQRNFDKHLCYYKIGFIYFNRPKPNEQKANEDFKQAIEYFQQAIKQSSNECAFSYYQIGNVYYAEQEYDMAIGYYNQSLGLRENIPNPLPEELVYSQIGNSYYNKPISDNYSNEQKTDSALKYYNKAIEKNQNFAEPYHYIGNMYYLEGKYKLAIENYNKVVDLFNKHIQYTYVWHDIYKTVYAMPAYYFIGNAFLALKQYDKAIAYYDRAKELYPNSLYEYNMSIGNVYFQKQKYEKADSCYQEAIKLSPDCLECATMMYFQLGFAYSSMQKYDKAVECFKKAVDIAPNNKSKNIIDGLIQLLDLVNFFKSNPNDDLFNKYLKNINTDNLLFSLKSMVETLDEIKNNYTPNLLGAFDAGKGYWLVGYIYYVKSNFNKKNTDAINNFIKSAKLGNEEAKQWLKEKNVHW